MIEVERFLKAKVSIGKCDCAGRERSVVLVFLEAAKAGQAPMVSLCEECVFDLVKALRKSVKRTRQKRERASGTQV